MLKKISTLLAVGVLALGLAGASVATASTSAAAEPKAYGLCAAKTGGGLRLLEPKNLPKSRYGKCRSKEKKVLVPSLAGVPTPVAPKPTAEITLSYKGASVICTVKDGSTVAKAAYTCVDAPTPPPTPAS